MWNFVIQLIVAVVISYVLAPKIEPPKPATIQDFDIPNADEGREMPVAFGSPWQSAAQVCWYGHLRTQPIKSKGGKK